MLTREGAPILKRHSNSGFSMIEIVIVLAISIVLAGIAIPVFTNAMNNFRLSATVSAVSGAISTTRMQAIMHGYPYETVFTISPLSFQIFNEVPPATTFSVVVPGAGSSVTPLPSAGGVTMTGLVSCTAPPSLTGCVTMAGTTITYTFMANGTVTILPAGAGIQIKNAVKSNTIWVSGVGNVSTSNP